MGRLTKINEDACDLCKSWVLCKDKNCLSYEVYKKLAHYEDLEEQLMESAEIDIDSMVGEFMHYYKLQKENRLIELPCAVGDEVYIPNERFPAEIEEIRITPQGIFIEYVQYDRSYEITEVWDTGSFCIEDIGKEVFLTIKEEALAKLKEWEGDKE